MKKQEFINRVLLIMNEAGLYDKDGNSFIGADTAQVDRYIEGSYVDAWRRCAGVMPKAWFKNASFRSATHKSNLPDGTGYVILPDDFYLLTYFKMQGWNKPVTDAYILNERTSSIQSNPYTRGSQIRPVAVIDPVAAIEYIQVRDIEWMQQAEPAVGEDGQSWYNTLTKELKVYFSATAAWANWEGLSVGLVWKYANKYFKISKLETENNINKVTLEDYDPYSDIKQALTYYSLKSGLNSHIVEEAIYVPTAKPISPMDGEDELELDHRITEPMAYLSASSVFTIFEKYDIAKALEQRVVEMFPAFKSIKGTNVTFKQ